MPFGGVGHSGMGRGHGHAGFESFSNVRGVFDQKLPFAPTQMLYPPYGKTLQQKIIDFTVRWL